MSDQVRRKVLFTLGAEALRAVTGHQEEDLYACPLCRRVFSAEALEGPDPTLTLEHVPPESLGGRALLLSCKRCNNEGGRKLDAEAVNRREFTRAVRALVLGSGEYEGKATWQFGGERMAGQLIARERNVRLNVAPEATDPQAGPRARTRVMQQQRNDEGVRFSVSPAVRFRLRESQLGDLRIGFLLAFALLGYSYAFHPRLEQVRRQIVQPEDEVLPPSAFWAYGKDASPDHRRMIITDDPEILGIQLDRAWVFLPWTAGPGMVAERLEEFMDNWSVPLQKELRWPTQLELAADLKHAAEDRPPLFRLIQ